MKREGRQHGVVRTHEILSSPFNPRRPDNCKFLNRTLDSPPTAGLFSKVQSKPTNHSKFTGKCTSPRCNGCHKHPFAKSKDKTKGSHKRRSNDVVANYRLVTWRVVDDGPPSAAMNFEGFSATDILNHLASRDFVDDDDFGHDESELLLQLGSNYYGYCDENLGAGNLDSVIGCGTYLSGVEITEIGDDHGDTKVEEEEEEEVDINDDDGMSFCDVGYIVELIEGEEGWCFVDEM